MTPHFRKLLKDIQANSSARMAWELAESAVGLYLERRGWIKLDPPHVEITPTGIEKANEEIET